MKLSEEQSFLANTFMPLAYEKQLKAYNTNQRFVHYTSADVAKSIIENESVWMRKTTTMNDFSEVEHGLELLANAWKDKPSGKNLKDALDSLYPDTSKKLEEYFAQWENVLRFDTYITSLSEHSSSEDSLGRLSMWRAYGRPTGVALVCRPTAFLSPTDALKVYSSPVAYLSDNEFENELNRVAANIRASRDSIVNYTQDNIVNVMFTAFRFAIQSIKHKGFEEEREWRIIYNPLLDESEKVTKSIRSVRGVPQKVYEIPLKDFPEEGLVGASIPTLLDRVIIGPSDYAAEIAEVMRDLLEAKGVDNSAAKVVISGIPLR